MAESVVKDEKYDFEKMIEEAMKKYGEQPGAVMAPPQKSNNPAHKKAGPSVGAIDENGEKPKSARKFD